MDCQNDLGYIHIYPYEILADRWHLVHSLQGSMQEHSYPVNISGQSHSQNQTHIVAWQSLKTKSVQHAFLKNRSKHQFTTFANATIASQCALRTNACHTPDWGWSVSNHTLLGPWAWVAHKTWILTSLTHASQLWRTISVHATLRLLCLNS